MQEKIISLPCTDGTKLDLHLYSWDGRKLLREQNIILPVIKEPFINALATSDADEEEMQVLAIIDGIMEALSNVDMEKLAERLVEGSHYRPKNGASLKAATLDVLFEQGVELAGIYQMCIEVIKLNYGTLLKKDLLASFLPSVS